MRCAKITWFPCIDIPNAVSKIGADQNMLAAHDRHNTHAHLAHRRQCSAADPSSGSKYSSRPLPAAVWFGAPTINTSVAYRRNTISKQYRTRESHHTRMHCASKRQMASGDRIRGQHVQLKMCSMCGKAGRQSKMRECVHRDTHYRILP